MAGIVPVAESLEDIYTEDALSAQTSRWDHLLSQFQTVYSHPAHFVSRSPGRVNIIGEHIDYSLYATLPMAITADVILAVATLENESTSSYQVKVANVQPSRFPSREFTLPYDTVDIDASKHDWTNYFKAGLRGALELLRRKHGADFKPKSLEILMDGAVPVGGGLSSSAAFVTASALGVLYANGYTTIDKTELTELAIVSERAVGVNSGGLDQSASVFSLRGSALFVSFVPSLTARSVQFPKTDPELCFVIAQSFVTSNKQVTGPVCYNLRVVECSLAAAYLHAVLNKTSSPLPPDSGPLGISLQGFQQAYFKGSNKSVEEQLQELLELTKQTLKEDGYTREEISPVIHLSVPALNERFTSTCPVRAEKFKLRQRALHVFSEALRVLHFLSILESPSSLLAGSAGSSTETLNKALGDLMNATQDSCRDTYECSCPELDELCAIARKSGSYGSRLTGAGWGGCSVHLVPVHMVDDVKRAWESQYYSKRELTEEQKGEAVVVSRPGGGSAVFVVQA